MKRRTLLQLLATSAVMPSALALGRGGAKAEAVLVVLELRGGNDGLNTLIPWRDPLYQRARPTLAINQALPLGDGLGLHPALAPLEPLWRQGRMAFALGVGWPNPNRSHFKAMDQWATGSTSGMGPGWLAAAMDQRAIRRPLVSLSALGSKSVEGGQNLDLQMTAGDLRGLHLVSRSAGQGGDNPILGRMLEMERAGAKALDRLRAGLKPLPAGVTMPADPLGAQLALALRLIASPDCPAVLSLTQAGYDTHAAQRGTQARLFSQLATALRSFEDGLAQIRQRPRVLLLTVSEFGRRLRENGSQGTDHGSASVAFLLGDPVGSALPHPWLGSYPRLDQLDGRGDLIPGISPPELYRQVLRSLWG